jgi:diaminopimelate decarboxylase
MHEFKYKSNKLYCENVCLEKLAREFSTPLYVYSYKTLTDHFNKIKRAFKEFRPLICYSVKSNANLSLLRILVGQGAGLDVVSGGELYKALSIGVNPGRIVYASVGKTDKEIMEAIKAGILFFNVESVPELENINRLAAKLKKKVKAALRINPDVDPQTHEYITTSKKENKFGIDLQVARDIFSSLDKYPMVEISGLHLHIGSQITKAKPYQDALKKVIRFIAQNKIRLEYINLGGGLGIVYDKEKPQTAESFAQAIAPLLRKIKAKLILEPGRFIVGNSGVLLAQAVYIKEAAAKTFIITDTAMNDLMRPSLYKAYHNILPLKKARSYFKKPVDIVGPVCESGDFLAKSRKFPQVSSGDFLAVLGAGAYGFSMSSNYNARPRAAEVLVRGSKYYLIRRRETYKDLIQTDIKVKGI